MKKLFAIVAMVAACSFWATTSAVAQEEAEAVDVTAVEEADTTAVDSMAEEETVEAPAPIVEEENERVFKTLKTKYIEGGAGFMSLVAIAAKGKVAEAIEKAKGTRGPVAQVSRKALECLDSNDRNDIGTIERTINMEAEVQGTYLEENCSWITLFIAMAPSLGFLGTVIGMVMAFDDIQRAGDISPTVVAGGMKVALITTIFGIIVALILQVFYNYILSKVEALTSNMEEAAQDLLVMCVKSDKCKK